MRCPRPVIPTQWWGIPIAIIVIVACEVIERYRKVRR